MVMTSSEIAYNMSRTPRLIQMTVTEFLPLTSLSLSAGKHMLTLCVHVCLLKSIPQCISNSQAYSVDNRMQYFEMIFYGIDSFPRP